MNLDAWDRLLSDLRKLSAEIDQKKKDVEAYELFLGRTKRETTQVLKEAA